MASDVARLIGVFSKDVLIVTGLAAMAEGASAATVAIVASAVSATPVIRRPEAKLRAMSLKTNPLVRGRHPTLEIPVVH